MLMKKTLVVIMALVLCFSFYVSTFAMPEESNINDEANAIPQLMSQKLQIKEDEANEKYNKLLKSWAYNPEYIDDVKADFPSFYGGAYIDYDKNLVIQVTTLNENVFEYFEKTINLSNVVFEEVKYSYEELKSEHAAILEKLNLVSEDKLISSISGVGISFQKNAINLYIVTPETNAKSTHFIQEVKNRISSFENIEIIATSGKDTFSASVYPGSKITNGSYNRSVGFWAYDSNNNLGIVTAPHNNMSNGDTVKIGTTTFGTAGTPYFSGNTDAVFVRRTNTSFTETRYVSGWGFNLVSSGYTVLAVGSTTYSKGFKSGLQTGIINDVNYTTSYGINNCVVSSATAIGGDSGGIVAGSGSSTSRYVAGIITGTQGGTNYVIYVKAGNILSTLNASVY